MKSMKAPYLMEFYHKDLSFKSRPTFRQGVIFYEWTKAKTWTDIDELMNSFKMIVLPIKRPHRKYYESKFTTHKNLYIN